MMKHPIAVLYGGRGVEHDVSLLSAKAVLRAAKKAGIKTLPICIEKNGDFFLHRTKKENLRVFPHRADAPCFLSETGEKFYPKAVFPILHGDFGEDGSVQGLLCAVGFKTLGVDTHAGALTSDKYATKLIAEDENIPTLPSCFIPRGTEALVALSKVKRAFGENPFPLFLKPNFLGSSVGACPVENSDGFLKNFPKSAAFGAVLIEPMLPHPEEWEVAYLKGYREEYFGPGRIITSTSFYDFNTKYKTKTATVDDNPALPKELASKALAYAESLVQKIGIDDLCRVDFFRVGDDLYFNEINPIPGLTQISMYPKLLHRAGLSLPGLIKHFERLSDARGV